MLDMAVSILTNLTQTFSDEARKIRELTEQFHDGVFDERSNTGDLTWTSESSGFSWDTSVGSPSGMTIQMTDANVNGRGEDGLLFMLNYYFTRSVADGGKGNVLVTENYLSSLIYAIRDSELTYGADGGASDAYAISLEVAPTAYIEGMAFNFKANTANTGVCTLNVNGLGAINIKNILGGDLDTGAISAGQIVTVVYNGANFVMTSVGSDYSTGIITSIDLSSSNYTLASSDYNKKTLIVFTGSATYSIIAPAQYYSYNIINTDNNRTVNIKVSGGIGSTIYPNSAQTVEYDGNDYIFSATQYNDNYIINGGFIIKQRGASQTSSGYGSDDRWYNDSVGTTKVHTIQSFTIGQSDVPGNPKYFSRTVVTSVSGSANRCDKIQYIDDVNTLSGGIATLSFWAKSDATRNIAIEFFQNFGSGGSSTVIGIGVEKISLNSSWNKYIITANIPSVSGKTIGEDSALAMRFWFDAGSDYDAQTDTLGHQSGTFDIAQVKLEFGSIATPYISRNYGEELFLCQQFYETSYTKGVSPGAVDFKGAICELSVRNVAGVTHGCRFKTEKRKIPTVTLYSPRTGAANYIDCGATDKAVSNINDIGTGSFGNVSITDGTTGTTFYHFVADAEL
jgi:hypothetical protein